MTNKRIRIRRTNGREDQKSKAAYLPKWEPFDIVRIKAGLDIESVPDILTVIRVIPDGEAEEREGQPGDAHEYRVRTILSGNEITLYQWQLEDVDSKYARHAVAFYSGVLSKLVATVKAHLEKDEADGEEHGWDDSDFRILEGNEKDEDDEPEPYRSDRRYRR